MVLQLRWPSKMKELITVRKEDLVYHLGQSLRMQAFDCAGVDNWEWADQVEYPSDTEALDIADHMEARANGNPS